MKKHLILLGLLGCILTFDQCKKNQSKENLITYPKSGLYGKNILSMQDSLNLDPSVQYSITATLQSNASLNLTFLNLNESKVIFDFNPPTNTNWSVIWITSDQIGFTALPGVSSDLGIKFSDTGRVKIFVNENLSQTLTKTIYVTLQTRKR